MKCYKPTQTLFRLFNEGITSGSEISLVFDVLQK